MREWHTEPISDLQKKKILSLMEQYPNYKLGKDLDTLLKGQAHSLIQLLMEKKLNSLIAKRVLIAASSDNFSVSKDRVIRYKISGGDDLASYSVFRSKVNGKLIQYEVNGSDIVFQIIEVNGEIPEDILKSTYLKVEKQSY